MGIFGQAAKKPPSAPSRAGVSSVSSDKLIGTKETLIGTKANDASATNEIAEKHSSLRAHRFAHEEKAKPIFDASHQQTQNITPQTKAQLATATKAAQTEIGQTLANAFSSAAEITGISADKERNKLARGIMAELVSKTQQGAAHVAGEQSTLSISDQTNAALLQQLVSDADLELATYCAKTGQRVSEINPKYLERACRFANLTSNETQGDKILARLCASIERLNQDAVSPLWLDTSPENLSALQVFDPEGYAVYSLSHFVSLHWKHEKTNTHSSGLPRALKTKRFKDRKRAYVAASRIPAPALTALNEAMHVCLGLIDPREIGDELGYFAAFDTIESVVLNPESVSNFISAIALTVCRLLMAKSTKGLLELHPSDFGTLSNTYGVFSNYRAQKDWRGSLRLTLMNTDADKMARMLPLMQAFAPTLAGGASFNAAHVAELEANVFHNPAPVSSLKQTLSRGTFGTLRSKPQQIEQDEIPALFDLISAPAEIETFTFDAADFNLDLDFDSLDDESFAASLDALGQDESHTSAAISDPIEDEHETEANDALRSLMSNFLADTQEPPKPKRGKTIFGGNPAPKTPPKPARPNPLAAAFGAQPTTTTTQPPKRNTLFGTKASNP